MYLFVDGNYVKEEEVRISPFDHGFLYGLGLFETFRTYNGHPFLVDDHFQRLQKCTFTIGLTCPPFKREEVLEIIGKLLQLNDLEDGYIRWNVSAGERAIGLSAEAYESPKTIVYVKEITPASKLGKSVTTKELQTLKLKRNTPEGEVRLKSHHYLNNILGKRELGNKDGVEGLFLDENGFVSEGLVSNIFWLKGDTLFSPSPTTGCLEGITRDWVLSFCKRKGMNIRVGEFRLQEAQEADEVFVTNSIQEIVAVNKWDTHYFAGEKGSFVQLLKEQYVKERMSLFSIKELDEMR